MTTSIFGSASKCRPKILIVSTSATRESCDGRLTALATKRLAAENAVLTVLNLTEYPLPLYPDRIDVPDDVPLEARSLHKLALRQNGVLLVTIARHGYLPKLLVNAIAWLGAIEAERRQSPERHRPVYALAAVSADAFGVDVAALKMRVSIEIDLKAAFLSTVLVRHACRAFDEAGELRDGRTAAALEHLTMQLVADSQCDAVSG